MAGQCSRRASRVSPMVFPSTPGLPLFPRTCFQAFTRLFRSHTSSMSRSSRAGRSGSRFAADGSVPCCTPFGASPVGASMKANSSWVFCRDPSMSRGPTGRSPPFGPSTIVSGSAYLFAPPFGVWSASRALPTACLLCPLLTSAHRVRSPHGALSPELRTVRRSPRVSLTAFAAHLPDLQPWPLMDPDFAISCPLVQPRMPRIRFLFVRSRFCSTLPPDPVSRRRPCASLALRFHQAVQRTLTSKLSDMPGTRLNRFAVSK